MTDRSGCDMTELAVLQVVRDLAGSNSDTIRSSTVLEEVDRRIGLGPSHAYPLICDLVTPWVIPVALLAMDGLPLDRLFTEPTPAAHTGCRLSPVGELVLAAEAGSIGSVPAGLINGTWWRGALRPPLDPFRVIPVLRRLVDDPGFPDNELLQLVGRPVSLTGSELTGDFQALADGRRTTIREAPLITRTAAPVPPAATRARQEESNSAQARAHTAGDMPSRKSAHLIIDAVPRQVNAAELHAEISRRIYPDGWQPTEPPPDLPVRVPVAAIRRDFAARALPIAALRDESKGDNVRFAIRLRPGADPRKVQEQLAGMKALTADLPSQFPAPLADLLRSWVAAHRHEDIAASLDQLEAAILAGRLAQQTDSD
jgi:hypothetical protein